MLLEISFSQMSISVIDVIDHLKTLKPGDCFRDEALKVSVVFPKLFLLYIIIKIKKHEIKFKKFSLYD